MKKKLTKQTSKKKAEAANAAATKKLVSTAEALAQKTKGITEFVVEIDLGFEAPILNTGIVVTVKDKDVTTPYIILNRLEKQPFFTAEQCVKINEAMQRNDSKTIRDIGIVCPTASVIPCLPGLPLSMLFDPVQGSILMGMFMFTDYMTSPLSRLRGSKTDVRYMASNTHVYFNKFPAGIGIGTTIDVVQCHFIPHLADKIYSKFNNFEPGTGRPTIVIEQDGHRINVATDPKFIMFKNPNTDAASRISTNVFDLMVLFEKLNDKITSLQTRPKSKKK